MFWIWQCLISANAIKSQISILKRVYLESLKSKAFLVNLEIKYHWWPRPHVSIYWRSSNINYSNLLPDLQVQTIKSKEHLLKGAWQWNGNILFSAGCNATDCHLLSSGSNLFWDGCCKWCNSQIQSHLIFLTGMHQKFFDYFHDER